MKKTNYNIDKVKQAYLLAHKKVADAIFDKSLEVLNNPRHWEGFENSTTYRKSGEVVEGAYRNIRDTGDLADSQKMSINHRGLAKIEWGGGETPAAAVYFGHVTESGTYVPGRPWLGRAIDELDDVGDIFKREFKKGR